MENKITTLPKVKVNKSVFFKLPQTPGIYIFWNENKPIYIGKSLNLRARLLSYLNLKLGPKTAQMVKESDNISYIKTTTELESLLLEAKLISTIKPKYNIAAKDDKHPLYIVITKDEFPRLMSSRTPNNESIKLLASYGPFPSSGNVRSILKLIRKAIPYSDHVTKMRSKICFYSHLGLCDPCPNTVNVIKNEEDRLKLKKLYLKNIKNIKNLLDGKFTLVEKNLISEMTQYSKIKDYEKAADIRDKLKALKYIIEPKIPSEEFLKNPNLAEDLKHIEISELAKLLSIHNTPVTNLSRIECFDIAHINGINATASMVVAINGEIDKSQYRHFRIKQHKSQSDYDSMVEIANRRIKNAISDNKLSWGRPDLIIVDGGLAQVKAFNDVCKNQNIPVVGIAKNPERIIFPDGKKSRLHGPVLKFMSRLRDEAHRFARRYHHLLMKKSLIP